MLGGADDDLPGVLPPPAMGRSSPIDSAINTGGLPAGLIVLLP